MPIYEFKCTACDNTEEHFQKVSDKNPEKCEVCGKTGTLQKMVSQTSFQLKGGGWYSDLYSSPKEASTSNTPQKKEEVAKPVPEPTAPKKDTTSE